MPSQMVCLLPDLEQGYIRPMHLNSEGGDVQCSMRTPCHKHIPKTFRLLLWNPLFRPWIGFAILLPRRLAQSYGSLACVLSRIVFPIQSQQYCTVCTSVLCHILDANLNTITHFIVKVKVLWFLLFPIRDSHW